LGNLKIEQAGTKTSHNAVVKRRFGSEGELKSMGKVAVRTESMAIDYFNAGMNMTEPSWAGRGQAD
jgi:hypothetical protein